MGNRYGISVFLPGWSLDDLAQIADTSRRRGEPTAPVNREAVADLLKALDDAGELDGTGSFGSGWTSEANFRSMVAWAAEKDEPLVEVPLAVMDDLIDRVRDVEARNAPSRPFP